MEVRSLRNPILKKLDTVSKALQDRPSLKLDIEGHVDMENDREGLKQLLFNRKIRAQKLKEMVKKGQPAVPVDDVKIEPAEYAQYLKMAYKQEKFPKPKNFIGIAKDIPAPEMEKLMLTHTEVKEEDLRPSPLEGHESERCYPEIREGGARKDIHPRTEIPRTGKERKDQGKPCRLHAEVGRPRGFARGAPPGPGHHDEPGPSSA